MKKITENNSFLSGFTNKAKYFLILHIFFLLFGLLPIILSTDKELCIWINQHHNEYLDIIFKYITFLGDGFFYGIVLIPLLFVKVRWSIAGLLSYISTGLIAQLLKHIFEMPRPKHFFANLDLNYVEGVTLYSNFSFPSGHTTSAFSLFLILSFLFPKNGLQVLFFVMALLVGFSRVYLMQHFYIDIYIGSIIGVAFTVITLYFFQKLKPYSDDHWLNKPLQKIL